MSNTYSPLGAGPGVPPVGNTSAGINFGPISGGASATTGQAPNIATVGQPVLSQDQGTLSQYFLTTVGGYQVDVSGTGLGQTTGQITIAAALNDLYQMPPAALEQLQQALLAAGYYEDASGMPLTSPGSISLGQVDNQTWDAFGRALVSAYGAHSPVMTIVNQRAAAGVGQAQQTTLPQAALGGGNVYQINLSNPEDVQYTANQIFQAALGRNATADEVGSITSSLRSQQTSAGLAQEQGGEQAAQARYGAEVNQRNIAYQFQKTPKQTGPIPAGPFKNNSDYVAALLGYMNLPVTQANVALMTSLAAQMGGQGMNPLGATNPSAGSTQGQGKAAQYANWQQSLQAVASELFSSKYAGLYNALLTGNPGTADQGALNQAIQTWSGGSIKTLKPTKQQQAQSAQSVGDWQYNQPQAPQGGAPPAGGSGSAAMPGNAQSMGAEPGSSAPTSVVNPPGGPGSAGTPGTAASMGAEGGGPNAATAVGQPTYPSVSPYATSPSQQPPNPGDVYINPTTVYTTNPASESAAAYNQATTGANRIPFAGNNYLNNFQAVMAMIQKGGIG